MFGLIGAILQLLTFLIKLALTPPKPKTPKDDIAEHLEALDNGDKEAFGHRRRDDFLERRK